MNIKINIRALILALAELFLLTILSSAEEARVKNVVDGDTIELTDGRIIRYIGIDTPETRKRKANRWVYDPQPFAEDAKEFNERLVFNKAINLEYDIERYDRYNRTLGYVVADGTFVNLELVKAGYAKVLPLPPNLKYAGLFEKSESEARRNHIGVWSLSTTKKTDPFMVYMLKKLFRGFWR